MSETRDGTESSVPRNTTPTWEMELLVSGATIFGLLQLPQVLDHAYFKAMSLSPLEYAKLLNPLWMYSKLATITLVLTFIAHLCLRGYWVALVGMNSVYPGGILWHRLRPGPIAQSRIEKTAPSMAEIIEHADNRATRIFATGFGFAMVMIKLVIAVTLMLVVCLLVDTLWGPGYTLQVFAGLGAALMLPWAFAAMVDRRFGHKLVGNPRAERLVGGVMDFYSRFGMGGGRSNTLIALFTSHEGRVRGALTGMMFLLPVFGVIIVQSSIAKGQLPPGLYIGLSTVDPYSRAVSPNAFYGNGGDDRETALPLPHIPARVVQGAYLELFIPFIPRLHGPAMHAACPEALLRGNPGTESVARLRCLSKLSALEIDGKPIAVQLDGSTDAGTGQPGMLAMIPVDSLPVGRHELSLSEPARASLAADDGSRRYRIAFWK